MEWCVSIDWSVGCGEVGTSEIDILKALKI